MSLRVAIIALFLTVALGLFGISALLFQYYRIASTLPSVDDLRQRAAQFETTRILDRNGNVLYEILDPTAGRRTYVSLDKISPYLVAATVATEDKGFYSHPGFDLTAIFRAFLQNYRSDEIVSGASTITQQLARSLLFTPEERSEQSYMRKVREAILAAEITRRYSKDEILELYLNEFNYGNLAYGVEAASQTYFGTSADKLTLAQAAFLAGLPQAPSVYDVYTNREATMLRMADVLYLMYTASQEQGCIFVSNSLQRVCVDALVVADASKELQDYEFNSPDIEIRYPHWVNYVRSLLEGQYDPQTIYRSGFSVYTTLDPALQDLAEQTVADQVETLKERNANNGALVAIRPTGEIRYGRFSGSAMKPSTGGVNMAVGPANRAHPSSRSLTLRLLRKVGHRRPSSGMSPQNFHPPAIQMTLARRMYRSIMTTVSTDRLPCAQPWLILTISRRSKPWISSRSTINPIHLSRKGWWLLLNGWASTP
jgi:membrane peptidoglycan carboxypeptidase